MNAIGRARPDRAGQSRGDEAAMPSQESAVATTEEHDVGAAWNRGR